jgi:hypothetical protein
VHLHVADGFCHDALKRAAPASVNCRDGALFWINEENRNAIGGLNP